MCCLLPNAVITVKVGPLSWLKIKHAITLTSSYPKRRKHRFHFTANSDKCRGLVWIVNNFSAQAQVRGEIKLHLNFQQEASKQTKPWCSRNWIKFRFLSEIMWLNSGQAVWKSQIFCHHMKGFSTFNLIQNPVDGRNLSVRKSSLIKADDVNSPQEGDNRIAGLKCEWKHIISLPA